MDCSEIRDLNVYNLAIGNVYNYSGFYSFSLKLLRIVCKYFSPESLFYYLFYLSFINQINFAAYVKF